jgi:hypothetical protein
VRADGGMHQIENYAMAGGLFCLRGAAWKNSRSLAVEIKLPVLPVCN